MSFKDFYYQQVRPKLIKELKIDNLLAVPKIKKIVLNVGVGEGAQNRPVIDKVVEELTTIAGQKAVPTAARKSVSAFKIRKGVLIGVRVTLRGKKMYDFLEKLIKIVLPRTRDFRGVSEKNLDGRGNLNLGISEQILFPEISYDKINKVRGLQITIVTDAGTNEKAKKLFESFGMPFAQDKRK